MVAPWTPVVTTIPVAYGALCYAFRPRGEVVGPRRLAALRAAVALGAWAVASVELLSAAHALNSTAVAVVWLVGAAVALGLARWRAGPARPDVRAESLARLDRGRAWWREAGHFDRFLVATTAALAVAEALMGLLATPNNYDSQTYHLPRVEHWVSQGSVAFYPTAIHRQVDLPPGAEYLLVHLRLLTGGDSIYALSQWVAGLGAVLIASRIAAQLGGGRRAQLITAFLVATIPMLTLQASSTQTDLVAAAWTACALSLAVDGWRAGPAAQGTGDLVALGIAVGLTALSKTPGLFVLAPALVVWVVTRGRARGWARAAGAAAVAGVLALAVVGPFTWRVNHEFGDVLGPLALRDSIPMERHDPASVLVNGMKIIFTALDAPVPGMRGATAAVVDGVARVVGVDPEDRATTFGTTKFPVAAWYPDEDRVSFPLQGALALIAVAVCLIRPRRLDPENQGLLRAYAGVLVAAAVIYAAAVKWQPWGNRLLLFLVVAAAPLAGRWLAARAPAVPGKLLLIFALSAILAVGYGFPRRLVGAGSVFSTSGYASEFLRRPRWLPDYEWAAGAVRASGARTVGVVEGNDDWEYPWWRMLPGVRIVALTSVLPRHPAPDPATVDAIVCSGTRAACARVVPPGWDLHWQGYTGYALAPAHYRKP